MNTALVKMGPHAVHCTELMGFYVKRFTEGLVKVYYAGFQYFRGLAPTAKRCQKELKGFFVDSLLKFDLKV